MNYYLHRLLFKTGFFRKVNWELSTVINNKQFRMPVIHEAGYHNILPTEPWLHALLQDMLAARPGALIDVGMNIGQTLLKTASIDSNRKYIGFEPNPLCYHVCRAIITANNLPDYDIFPCGLFDKEDILTLYTDKDYGSGASVLKDFRKNMQRYHQHINVPVFRGDNIKAVQDEKEIAIIKADVEGAELEVIKGLAYTINRTKPFIILEILPVYNLDDENGRYRKRRQDELLAALQQAGYNCYLIREKELQLQSLNDIEVHGDMGRTNYLFVHRDHDVLIKQFGHFKKS